MRDESSSGRMEKPAYAVGPPSWRFSTAFLAGRSFCKKFALLRKIFHLERQFPSLGAQIYGPIVHILLICLLRVAYAFGESHGMGHAYQYAGTSTVVPIGG